MYIYSVYTYIHTHIYIYIHGVCVYIYIAAHYTVCTVSMLKWSEAKKNHEISRNEMRHRTCMDKQNHHDSSDSSKKLVTPCHTTLREGPWSLATLKNGHLRPYSFKNSHPTCVPPCNCLHYTIVSILFLHLSFPSAI